MYYSEFACNLILDADIVWCRLLTWCQVRRTAEPNHDWPMESTRRQWYCCPYRTLPCRSAGSTRALLSAGCRLLQTQSKWFSEAGFGWSCSVRWLWLSPLLVEPPSPLNRSWKIFFKIAEVYVWEMPLTIKYEITIPYAYLMGLFKSRFILYYK